LPEAASSSPTDYFMVVQNGVNKKLSLTTFLKTLNSSDNIQINSLRLPINVRVSSTNAPNLIYVSGSADFVGINTSTPASRLHILGNVQVGSTSDDGVVIHAEDDVTYTSTGDLPQGVGWFKPLNAARDISALTISSGVTTGQFDLGNGTPGQYKSITFVTGPSGSKATIRVTAGVGFNRIDLTGFGQSVVLKCITISSLPKWVCVGSYLANIYTV